jgi:hypothetical protein
LLKKSKGTIAILKAQVAKLKAKNMGKQFISARKGSDRKMATEAANKPPRTRNRTKRKAVLKAPNYKDTKSRRASKKVNMRTLNPPVARFSKRCLVSKKPNKPASLATMSRVVLRTDTESPVKTCLNTQVLVAQVKNKLNQLGMNYTDFSRIIQVTASWMSRLLMHPKPWATLGPRGKHSYIRMQNWLAEKNTITKSTTSLEHSANQPCSTSTRYRVRVQTDKLPDTLDTAEVAKSFRTLLEAHSINIGYFAKRVCISIVRMRELLRVPPPAWTELNEKEKKIYMHMYALNCDSPVNIAVLMRASNNFIKRLNWRSRRLSISRV